MKNWKKKIEANNNSTQAIQVQSLNVSYAIFILKIKIKPHDQNRKFVFSVICVCESNRIIKYPYFF